MLKHLLQRFVYVVLLLFGLGANIGHTDWAEQVLQGFSWGHSFFEVNGGLLERYAQCQDAEEVGKVQEAWLARLEREWTESREDKGDQDEWAGGNPNRQDESMDEYESDEDGGENRGIEEQEKHDDGEHGTNGTGDLGL